MPRYPPIPLLLLTAWLWFPTTPVHANVDAEEQPQRFPRTTPDTKPQPTIQQQVWEVLKQRDERIGGSLRPAETQAIKPGLSDLEQLLRMDPAKDPRGEVVRPKTTFFEMANLLTGPKSTVQAALEGNVLTSWMVEASEVIIARTHFNLWKYFDYIGFMCPNVCSEEDQEAIVESLKTSFWLAPDSLKISMEVIDDFLAREQAYAERQIKGGETKKVRQAALKTFYDIQSLRASLIPPLVTSSKELGAMVKSGELKVGDHFRNESGIVFKVVPEEGH